MYHACDSTDSEFIYTCDAIDSEFIHMCDRHHWFRIYSYVWHHWFRIHLYVDTTDSEFIHTCDTTHSEFIRIQKYYFWREPSSIVRNKSMMTVSTWRVHTPPRYATIPVLLYVYAVSVFLKIWWWCVSNSLESGKVDLPIKCCCNCAFPKFTILQCLSKSLFFQVVGWSVICY